MNVNEQQKDLSERTLRKYLASRKDVSDIHKEKIVEHYMFVFDPNYSDEAAQKHIDEQAANDPEYKIVAIEVLTAFWKWVTSETKHQLNFIDFLRNLFNPKRN